MPILDAMKREQDAQPGTLWTPSKASGFQKQNAPKHGMHEPEQNLEPSPSAMC